MYSVNVSTRDASSVNITSSYSELVTSIAQEAHFIIPAFTATAALIIGIGASGAEVNHVVLAAGTANSTPVPCLIPKGARVSIKSLGGGTVSSGGFGFTFLF